MERPLRASQARRPLPLVIAPRAASSRGERVPHCPAGLEWRLGRSQRVARPETVWIRLPVACRAADALEGAKDVGIRHVTNQVLGRSVILQEPHTVHYVLRSGASRFSRDCPVTLEQLNATDCDGFVKAGRMGVRGLAVGGRASVAPSPLHLTRCAAHRHVGASRCGRPQQCSSHCCAPIRISAHAPG